MRNRFNTENMENRDWFTQQHRWKQHWKKYINTRHHEESETQNKGRRRRRRIVKEGEFILFMNICSSNLCLFPIYLLFSFLCNFFLLHKSLHSTVKKCRFWLLLFFLSAKTICFWCNLTLTQILITLKMDYLNIVAHFSTVPSLWTTLKD